MRDGNPALLDALHPWGHSRIQLVLATKSMTKALVCLDYLSVLWVYIMVVGSPPRLRGLLGLGCRCLRSGGITPASAGTTSSSPPSHCSHKDHPRVCGDYFSAMLNMGSVWGSPPRLRGLPMRKPGSGLFTGITPASAGTTELHRTVLVHPEDHPRVCGDYCSSERSGTIANGSPPRLRGLLTCPGRGGIEHGITPASAGTTVIRGSSAPPVPDHPRVCGDYYLLIVCELPIQGSPPRLRGLLRSVRPDGCKRRITPASAGTTFFLLSLPSAP